MGNRCWYSGKLMFSEEGADKVIKSVNEQRGKKHLRAKYLCEKCNAYHVTSMYQPAHHKIVEERKNKKSFHQDRLMDEVDKRIAYLRSKNKGL